MKTVNMNNNETISSGIIADRDGTFTAMTFTQGKNFKTEAGAKRWYARMTGK